jgi:hypothetical protein
MPKRITSTDAEALAFGRRLTKLLADSGQPRRGAGAYLAKRYKVATVTANAWLNGEYKANTTTARQIAVDHGGTFDELYFGVPASVSRIDADHQSQLLRLDPVTLFETARTLRERLGDDGLFGDLVEHNPLLFMEAYALYANNTMDKRTPELERSLAMKIADLTPQGATKDERGTTVPAQGTPKPKVGPGTRREA